MATIRERSKNGKKYVFIDSSQAGKRSRESLGPADQVTKRQAKLELNSREIELATGKPVFTYAPLFEEFVTEYLQWHALEFRDSHARTLGILTADHVKVAFYGKPLSDPKMVEHIEKWRAKRKERVKHNTVVKEYNAVKAMFRKAVMWRKGIATNPCGECTPIRPRKGKPPVWFRREQAAALYKELHGQTWRLACNTGMRRGELLACEPSWFDLERQELTIVSQEGDSDGGGHRTKSGHFRTVPLNSAAIEAFRALTKGREDQRHVLPRIAPESLSRAFKIDLKRANLAQTRASLHCTRHTYAAHMCNAGVSLRILKELLGHASIRTTEIYAHLCKDAVREQTLAVAV